MWINGEQTIDPSWSHPPKRNYGRIDWIYSYVGPGMEGFKGGSDYLFLREIEVYTN